VERGSLIFDNSA